MLIAQTNIVIRVLVLRYSHPMLPKVRAPVHPANPNGIARPWRTQSKERLAAVAMLTVPLDSPGLVVPSGAQDTRGILLIKRSDRLRGHSGQWALPGGKQDPQESLLQTARRELAEETGLNPDRVHWQSDLGHLITGTGYRAQVILGALKDPQPMTADGSEAVMLSAYPLEWLLREDTYRHREVGVIGGRHFSWGHPDPELDWEVPLWGATAFMLLELRRRLRPDLPEPDSSPIQ